MARDWPLVVRVARASDEAAVLSFATDTWDGWDYIHEVWDDWVADYSRIRDAIAATYPDIFHDFNARMWTPGGFHRPLECQGISESDIILGGRSAGRAVRAQQQEKS